MPTLNLATVRPYDDAGIRRRVIPLYTGPSSYVAGGDPFTEADVKLGEIESFGPGAVLAWSGTAVRLLVYDYTNKKVVWYIPNTGAEVAGAQDLSAFTCRPEIVGK